MDRKTLDYLEDRAKKGREIVSKIASLTDYAKRIEGGFTSWIELSDEHGNRQALIDCRKHSRISRALSSAALHSITEEIALLEAELAEL